MFWEKRKNSTKNRLLFRFWSMEKPLMIFLEFFRIFANSKWWPRPRFFPFLLKVNKLPFWNHFTVSYIDLVTSLEINLGAIYHTFNVDFLDHLPILEKVSFINTQRATALPVTEVLKKCGGKLTHLAISLVKSIDQETLNQAFKYLNPKKIISFKFSTNCQNAKYDLTPMLEWDNLEELELHLDLVISALLFSNIPSRNWKILITFFCGILPKRFKFLLPTSRFFTNHSKAYIAFWLISKMFLRCSQI